MIKNLLAAILLLLALPLLAKDLPPRPNPPRLVNDYARMLSSEEVNALERKLVAYNDSTSTQIAIVTERSLEGEDVFDYSVRLANAWGIGQQDKSNGILIYIALDDRKIYIQTGYGSEGFLPDAIAKRIIENIIKPAFRDQRYYEGFNRATDAIIAYGAGEYTADGSKDENVAGAVIGMAILLIIVLFFVFILVAAIRAGKNNHDDDDHDGGYWRGGRYDEPRHRHRGGGGWVFFPPTGGGFGGGGSGGFGGGGGGFGGFGGGSFGGGGAGGSW
ncbi:MAG TPA: TPM domain-containing protein [Saprospiraceae bacterium]|nr:TPM domain-containing protein [Saprospiraceae bacterium]HMP25021.1 TPM domain-containing protein [Saprospiraceae bacterium]